MEPVRGKVAGLGRVMAHLNGILRWSDFRGISNQQSGSFSRPSKERNSVSGEYTKGASSKHCFPSPSFDCHMAVTLYVTSYVLSVNTELVLSRVEKDGGSSSPGRRPCGSGKANGYEVSCFLESSCELLCRRRMEKVSRSADRGGSTEEEEKSVDWAVKKMCLLGAVEPMISGPE